MQFLSRRSAFKGLLASGAGLAAVADRSAIAETARAHLSEPDLVFHGHGFFPMTSHIQVGASIELVSRAHGVLDLAAAPTAPAEIRCVVKPGGKTSVQFDKTGLYLLYDAASTRFDETVGQVVAHKDARQFPLPAYTIVLVTDPQGRGLAPTEAKIHIPDSSMTFEPWSLVVRAGHPVSFVNNDMDAHIVMPSPVSMMMPGAARKSDADDAGLRLQRMQSFSPITLMGHGGKGSLALLEPGLHHYYCPVHAAYDAAAFTFASRKSYGSYPFIMDGVIVVLPS